MIKKHYKKKKKYTNDLFNLLINNLLLIGYITQQSPDNRKRCPNKTKNINNQVLAGKFFKN